MQLKYLVTLLCASLAIAYTTVDLVIADIIYLDNAVRQLIVSTQAYTGGVLLVQGTDFTNVEGRLTKANTDVTLLPPQDLSVADTYRLVSVVSHTLAVDNPRAVDTLISKKALIEATPLQGGIVEAGLQSLLRGHLYFSNEALQRTPPSEMADVQEQVDIISNALQKGIDAFSA